MMRRVEGWGVSGCRDFSSDLSSLVIDHPENKILLFQLLILHPPHASGLQTFYSEYTSCSKDDYKLVIDVYSRDIPELKKWNII